MGQGKKLNKLKKRVIDYSKLLGFIPNNTKGYCNDNPSMDDIRYLLNNCYNACVPSRNFHK